MKKVGFFIYAWGVMLSFFIIHFFVATIGMCFFKNRAQAHMNFTKYFLQIYFILMKVKIHIKNIEHLPSKGPFSLVANHQSMIDIMLCMVVIQKPFAFIAKEELRWVPFVGLNIMLEKHFFINRKGEKDLSKQFSAIRSDLERGRSLLVFPEGTRSFDGTLNPFKTRFFKLALETKTTLIPVCINGSGKILPKKKIFPSHGDLSITLGLPIKIPTWEKENTDLSESEKIAGLRDLVYKTIEFSLGELDLERTD